jgi:hypothetical protein
VSCAIWGICAVAVIDIAMLPASTIGMVDEKVREAGASTARSGASPANTDSSIWLRGSSTRMLLMIPPAGAFVSSCQ